MNLPRPRTRRKVQVRALLAATAGASLITFASCGGFTSGNLIAPPDCGTDGGPPGCIPRDIPDGGDGGTGGDR